MCVIPESIGDRMEAISLKGRPYIELHNLLKVENWCESGGAAKHVIAEGMVSVDGVVELRKACKIKAGQTVTYEGQSVLVTD
jgi:ribosome-associated protein